MSDEQAVINGYTALVDTARLALRRYVKPNSCIASVRLVCELLDNAGIHAQARSVKWSVLSPALETAYAVGFSDEEMSKAGKRIPAFNHTGAGWNGHLVVIAEGDFLIDPTFGQAMLAIYGVDEPGYIIQSLPQEPTRFFDCEIAGKLDNGHDIKVRYIGADDDSWRTTEAWNDEGIPLLARELHGRASQCLQ